MTDEQGRRKLIIRRVGLLVGILATGGLAALYVGLTVATKPVDYNGVSRWWIVPIAPFAAAIFVGILSIKPVPSPIAILTPIVLGIALAFVIQEFSPLRDITGPLGETLMRGSRRRLFYDLRDLHLFTCVFILTMVVGWLMFGVSYYRDRSNKKKNPLDNYFALAGKVATWRLSLIGVLTVIFTLIFLSGWAATGPCALGLIIGVTAAFTLPILVLAIGFLLYLISKSFWRWISGRS